MGDTGGVVDVASELWGLVWVIEILTTLTVKYSRSAKILIGAFAVSVGGGYVMVVLIKAAASMAQTGLF